MTHDIFTFARCRSAVTPPYSHLCTLYNDRGALQIDGDALLKERCAEMEAPNVLQSDIFTPRNRPCTVQKAPTQGEESGGTVLDEIARSGAALSQCERRMMLRVRLETSRGIEA